MSGREKSGSEEEETGQVYAGFVGNAKGGCGSHRDEGGVQVSKQLMSTSRQLLPAPFNLC